MADEEKKEQEEETTQTSAEDEKTADNQSGGNQTQSNMVPYDRFQQVIEEKNEYKNELEQLKNQLEKMEDPEDVKEQYETKLEKMEKQSINREKEFVLKEAALKEGVNKAALDDFAKVADLAQLEVNDDGEVEGVEDLIKTMKEEKSYFFNTEEQDNTISNAGDEYKESGENNRDVDGLRKAMGLD